MRFAVTHETRYTYDRPVFIEPMTFRLRPIATPAQRPGESSLVLDPAPAGSAVYDDPYGNVVTRAWFSGTTERLVVRSSFRVETLRANPFDFVLVDPAAATLPMIYDDDVTAALVRYREPTGTVSGFAADVMDEVAGDVLAFLEAVTKRLHTFDYEIREEGDPLPPAETLATARGSCRDLTVLFMDACRSVGLAARFVSGYQRAGEEEGKRYMHAWPEVWLDGAGWRGYDPSLGLAVADGHVAVAAAPSAREAAPTSGTFRGTGVRSQLSADVFIAEE